MRTLADYKAKKILLQSELKAAEDPKYRSEITRDIRFTTRRITQIERRVLRNCFAGK